MKTILTSMAAGALLATLATAQTPRYTVTDLGTLGGTVGSANGINYEGRVAGAANLPQLSEVLPASAQPVNPYFCASAPPPAAG